MRNPFKKMGFGSKKETSEPHSPIKEPWNSKPDETKKPQANKTMVGKIADKPFLDKEEKSAFGSGYQCPECSYPLRQPLSSTTPCPNCAKNAEANEPKAPSAKKTLNFHDLNFGKLSGERKFTLINEAAPDMSITVDLEENPEVVLNREVLDPKNSTISGKEHILIREIKGVWMVKDLSSNGATFIQAIHPQAIQDGKRVILGSKIFRFSSEGGSVPKENEGRKTMNFGQFNLSNSHGASTFSLVDEFNGSAKNFKGQQVDLNRFNLDPEDLSISSSIHAIIVNHHGSWSIQDRSSNKSTFVQATHEVQLSDKMRMILGNRVYRFEIG